MSLHQPNDDDYSLFDFANVLGVTPSVCYVHLSNKVLSAEQSIVLATRPYPVYLMLDSCAFEDGGKAFVDALKERKISFGSLQIDACRTFDDDSLKRFCEVDMIDYLDIPKSENEQLAFLPVTAKAKYISFCVSPTFMRAVDLTTLKIVTKELDIYIGDAYTADLPEDIILSFWRRVADLGHFEKLHVDLWGEDDLSAVSDTVVQEIVRAALANPNLKELSLGSGEWGEDFGPHVRAILSGLQDHPSLCTLRAHVGDEDEAFGPDFSFLREFLSQNRIITVMKKFTTVYSDGSTIDELYSFNRFYRGSMDLVGNPSSERPVLVAAALMESALKDFRRSALLLNDHTDALYDVVQFAQLDEL